MPSFPDRITAMHPDLHHPTFAHSRQRRAVSVITDLIIELRNCSSAPGYFHFQRRLFGEVLLAQGRVTDLRRAIKRVGVGKAIDDDLVGEYAAYDTETAPEVLPRIAAHLPAPPRQATVTSDEYAWLHLEEVVARRIELQLRAVGDALAWRALGFDRRYVHALSRNERTGPMTTGQHRAPKPEEFVDLADGTTVPLRDTKPGLPWELGRAKYLFEKKGNFAILNDLTNVLRIGDLTEIDGLNVVLHEVKAPNRRQDPEQLRRGHQAIDSINEGAFLPGKGATRLRSSGHASLHHLGRLRQLVRQADRNGHSSGALEAGMVATVLSLGIPAERRGTRFPGDDRLDAAWKHGREVSQRRSLSGSPTVHATSLDTTGRAVEHAPWGIYPFEPDVCARLICDYLLIECAVSLHAIGHAVRRQSAEVKELPVPQPLGTADRDILLVGIPFGEKHPLINDHLQMKAARVTAKNLRQPLLESWTLDSWAQALVELLRAPDFRTGESVIPVFGFDQHPWL